MSRQKSSRTQMIRCDEVPDRMEAANGARTSRSIAFESILSDMAYEKYHLFRPTARMLPRYKPAPKDK
jgi:hypothetical protein